MTTNPISTTAHQRPRTLPEVIAGLEGLLAEAEGYATDSHGAPGKDIADAWSEKKSEAIRWAKAVLERIDSPGTERVLWKRTAANRFPSKDWELQKQHLRRVILELRQWHDEQALLGPAPITDPPVTPPAQPRDLEEMPRVASQSWMERHGWQALGVLIGLASLAVAIMAALRWGPFE